MMSAPAAQYARRVFTPAERASFLSWRFGPTLDWRNALLTEIGYPLELYWFVDAIQGLCKGKELRIAHSTLAKRAQRFKNKPQAKALALRAIAADRAWAREHCVLVFDIERPRPREMEGKDKRARTRYTDYLTPAAVWAQETEHKVKKAEELRWKDKEYRRGQRRLILAEALTMLPNFERQEDMPKGTRPKEEEPLSLSEYVAQRESILLAEKERIISALTAEDVIDTEEIDARAAMLATFQDRVLHEVNRACGSARGVLMGLRETRLQRAMNFDDPADVVAPVDEILAQKGNAGVPLIVPTEQPEAEPKKGDAHVPPTYATEPVSGGANIMLDEALAWASVGVEIFPVYEVVASLCVCPQGAGCRSPGKHPYWHAADLPEGKKNATTNLAQIKQWWTRWPHANIAARMGGAANLLALDIDPRNGGSASLSDFVEAHGNEWLQTRCHKTGGGGWHFFFSLPAGLEVHRAQLAPGVDLKHGNGYVLMPPSTHVSGWYMVENATPVLPAPAWLVEELTHARDAQPLKQIDFQDGQAARGQFGAGVRFFGVGERNNGLRDVALGRWVNGCAVDAADLFRQLREVRDTRCADGDDAGAADAQLWNLVCRTTQKFARGELREQ
jgi:hypothetical protein